MELSSTLNSNCVGSSVSFFSKGHRTSCHKCRYTQCDLAARDQGGNTSKWWSNKLVQRRLKMAGRRIVAVSYTYEISAHGYYFAPIPSILFSAHIIFTHLNIQCLPLLINTIFAVYHQFNTNKIFSAFHFLLTLFLQYITSSTQTLKSASFPKCRQLR